MSDDQRFDGTCPTCGQRYCGDEIARLQEDLNLAKANYQLMYEEAPRRFEADNARLRALSQNNAHSWDAIVKERNALRALLNDRQYIQMKADYNRGHLSWANMLNERERGLRLNGEKDGSG